MKLVFRNSKFVTFTVSFLMIMNILLWNVKGAGNQGFLRHVKNYISLYNDVLVVIMETKIGNV